MPRHRKPLIPARYRDHTIGVTVRNIPRGVLVAPVGDWTSPVALVRAMDINLIRNRTSIDIYSMLLRAFMAIGRGGVNIPRIQTFARGCYHHGRKNGFKQPFLQALDARRANEQGIVIKKQIHETVVRKLNTSF